MIAEAMAQSRWLASMRIRQRLPFNCWKTGQSVGEECFGIDAMRGVVRARVDATGFFQSGAEIAGRSFLFDDGFLAAGVFRIFGSTSNGCRLILP